MVMTHDDIDVCQMYLGAYFVRQHAVGAGGETWFGPRPEAERYILIGSSAGDVPSRCYGDRIVDPVRDPVMSSAFGGHRIESRSNEIIEPPVGARAVLCDRNPYWMTYIRPYVIRLDGVTTDYVAVKYIDRSHQVAPHDVAVSLLFSTNGGKSFYFVCHPKYSRIARHVAANECFCPHPWNPSPDASINERLQIWEMI